MSANLTKGDERWQLVIATMRRHGYKVEQVITSDDLIGHMFMYLIESVR